MMAGFGYSVGGRCVMQEGMASHGVLVLHVLLGRPWRSPLPNNDGELAV
jgi:hypothetical protein